MQIADSSAVLFRRCAWHRHYRGYSPVYGVAEWKGLRIGVVDGICKGCAARLRRDIQTPPPGWRPAHEALPTDPLPVPPLALGMIALAAVLFAAHPLDHPPHISPELRPAGTAEPPLPPGGRETAPAAVKRTPAERSTHAGEHGAAVPSSDREPLPAPGVVMPPGEADMSALREAAEPGVPVEPPAAPARGSHAEPSPLDLTARGGRPNATDEARPALALSSVQAP